MNVRSVDGGVKAVEGHAGDLNEHVVRLSSLGNLLQELVARTERLAGLVYGQTPISGVGLGPEAPTANGAMDEISQSTDRLFDVANSLSEQLAILERL